MSAGRAARWAWLALLPLSAPAILPLMRADSPCTHDGGLHYYRVVAMRQMVSQGLFFSRYVPDLAFGYGYPFFNYREPVSYYLTLALYLLGLGLPVALNLVYALSILGCALGAYLLARDLFARPDGSGGTLAGVVAGVAYAYAPYQFLDALLRGNAPESLALALMPLALWAFRRLALHGRRRDFTLSVAFLATLLLTHNISALLFVPLLLALLALLYLCDRRVRRAWRWLSVCLALGAAFGLTCFFWAPALLEGRYVQLHMSRVTRNNDFRYNFLGLAEMFAPPRAVDTSLLNPPMQVPIGLPLAVLGAGGLVCGLRRTRDCAQRATLALLGLAALGMLWLATPSSRWVWEHVPLLPFVQFPWRLVGRAALPLAMGVGGLFAPSLPARVPASGRRVLALPLGAAGLAIGALILCAFPALYPPLGYCPSPARPTMRHLFAYERRTGLTGVDPEGSYFPVWVEERPTGSPLEAQIEPGGPVARFDMETLPAGAALLRADYGPNHAELELQTPTAFRARYLVFYFPGWRVWVDGQPVATYPEGPRGLLAFDVPAGRHTVRVRFGETGLRLAADGVSLATLVALLGAAAWALRRARGGRAQPTPLASARLPADAAERGLLVLALGLGLLLVALKVVWVDRVPTPFRYPRLTADGTLPGLQHRLDLHFADGLRLLGYRLERERLPADSALRLDLYWTAYAQPAARYASVVHLVGPDGLRWSQPDSYRPRGYADHPETPTWDAAHYALDSHEVEPLAGTPPGVYEVVVTVFDRDTLQPLSLLNAQGQPAAPELRLGQIVLARPRARPQLPTAGRLDIALDGLTLATARFDRAQAAPGDSVFLATLWHAAAEGAPKLPCTPELLLALPDGTVVARHGLALPAVEWQVDDVWLSQQRLLLPAALETGEYTWRVACGAVNTPVGRLVLAAPPHVYTAPPVAHSLGETLGSLATLLGFDLSMETLEPGGVLTVTLVWRAEATAAESYHVFLHLMDAQGNLVAQSDGVPADWSRPTTGWLPGEIIVERRTLSLPAGLESGPCTLSAGLYRPGGERLRTPDGRDALALAALPTRPPDL
jgi:hypothetical protein